MSHFSAIDRDDSVYSKGGAVYCSRLDFNVTNGGAAGTHTGTVYLPAGNMIVDIIVYAIALWNAGTSADLIVGDYTAADVAIDADGFFASTSLKATDLLAEQTLRLSGNLGTAGGKIGAYGDVGTNTHLTDLYSASARKIVALLTLVGTTATTGRTIIDVLWCLPSDPISAVFAAT